MGVADASVAQLERTPRRCDCCMIWRRRTRRLMTRISCRGPGLVPVMALAQRCGLADLAAGHVRIGRPAGVNADLKVGCLVAGMAAGADSIDDMDVLRHGAMAVLFGGVRAPSTLGSFLRVVHLGERPPAGEGAPGVPGRAGPPGAAAARQRRAGLRRYRLPAKRVFGYQKQGRRSAIPRSSGKSLLVRGLNVLAATISTPLAAPVIAAARLRGGSAGSARGAASFITEAAGVAREPGAAARSWCGWTRRITARRPSAAVRRAGAFFSVTAQLNASVQAAIAAIPATPGRRSPTGGRCGMTSWAAGSLTPRSPR